MATSKEMTFKACLLTVLLLTGTVLATAQTLDEDSNWFKLVKDRDDYYSRFDFTRYSTEDVIAAAALYRKIEETTPADEWEGVYSTGIEVGDNELRWRSNQGYVFHYVYHTLGDLQYGRILSEPVFVRLESARTNQKKKSPLFTNRLVKVKIGQRHYLVPESRLKDFAERAVGRETDHDVYWTYWWKKDEDDLNGEGLPVYPKQYAHLILLPIETKILRIGRRTVVPSKSTTESVNYDDIYISVTLAHGANRGLKRGMDLFVPDLGEWIEVVKVSPRGSVGRIRRDFSLEGVEQCWDSEKGLGMPTTCKKLVAGFPAVTRPG